MVLEAIAVVLGRTLEIRSGGQGKLVRILAMILEAVAVVLGGAPEIRCTDKINESINNYFRSYRSSFWWNFIE